MDKMELLKKVQQMFPGETIIVAEKNVFETISGTITTEYVAISPSKNLVSESNTGMSEALQGLRTEMDETALRREPRE